MAAFAGFSFVALPWWVALIILACCFTFVVITSIGSIGTLGFVLISSVVQLIRIEPSNYGWLCYIALVGVVTLIMYVHRGNIKRLFQGKENPTNIRAAFKKDFKIGKKDEDVEVLKEAPAEEVVSNNEDVEMAETEQSKNEVNSQVKDVKIMSVDTTQDNNQTEN